MEVAFCALHFGHTPTLLLSTLGCWVGGQSSSNMWRPTKLRNFWKKTKIFLLFGFQDLAKLPAEARNL